MCTDLRTELIQKLHELKQKLRVAKIEKIQGKPINQINLKIEEDIKYYEELITHMYGKI